MFNSPRVYLTKVFIQIFLRNKQYILFSLILPVVILGIVGLNEGERDPIDLGLVDNAKSELSNQFITSLASNNLFNVIQDSEEALRDDLINGDLMIALIIPEGMGDQADLSLIHI